MVKKFLKKSKLLCDLCEKMYYSLYQKCMNKYLDIKVLKYLKERKKTKKNARARIAFIVQVPEVWNKEEDVYNEFLKRDKYDVYMILVPAYNMLKQKIGGYEDIPEYFRKYKNTIEAIDKNGNWKDISLYHFDYVFYQRPYDGYLPEHLRSCQMVKCSKICYIPYALWLSGETMKIGYGRDFFRNVSFGFLDTEYSARLLQKRYKRNRRKGIQYFEYLGYPELERYIKLREKSDVPAKNVLWAPRWTKGDIVAKSNFFEYKDKFTALAKKYPGQNFQLRPHPLAFDNYVASGMMSTGELENYKNDLKANNILIDTTADVYDIFENTDILIADISSIIAGFLLTGRPVIYCESNVKPTTLLEKIWPMMYIAYKWEDVEHFLGEICSGNDYLADKRREIIETGFSDVKGSVKKIVDVIEHDYYS